ncbi:MAG: formate dehydrogenase accessory protein FdhE [Spirochaetes bacterium]|nr:formate dehydrogenase accessory protein FdhE [Spirochaetota bacterium]
MEDHIAYLNDKNKTIQAGGVLTDDMISFYQDLFSYHRKQFDRIINDPRLPKIIETDLPVSKNGKAKVDGTALADLLLPGLAPIIEIVETRNPGLHLEPLHQAVASDPGTLSRILDAVLDMDADRLNQFAITHKISPDGTIFVLINWLKPFFISLREKSDILNPDTLDSPYCPFCGNQPDMAAIVPGSEGKRFLHCSLCENRWAYKRIACAVCGTEDAAMLEYLSAENDSRHRLDLCATCKGFMKTVCLEKFEDIEGCDLTVENILTASLDSAALKEGYHKP